MRRPCGHAKLVLALTAAALCFSLPISGQKTQSPPAPSPASPQSVCAFIVGRMKTSLPQEPTLCSGKQEKAPGYYSISIFSPKNVLEGDARRAWSSALFQTLEDLVEERSLNGACSTTPTCDANISDSYMAEHNWRYKIIPSMDLVSLAKGPSSRVEFSEDWYVFGWQMLFHTKESDSPGSKENATEIRKRACEIYVVALRKMSSERPVPTCSIMLANDKNIYLVLDFADWAYTTFGDITYEMLPTFGRMFEDTGYGGQESSNNSVPVDG